MHDDLDLAELIDGFPTDEPWIGAGAVWFDDLAAEDRDELQGLFGCAAATGRWPSAPDVARPDDRRLMTWVAATLHVLSRLRQETVAFADELIGRSRDRHRHRFISIPRAVGSSIDLIERARQPIDAKPTWIEMAMELNELTLVLADTGRFPSPPRSLERFVDLDGGHWASASYRHHRGREFYRRLDLELAHIRSVAVARGAATPWDLHAWVFALVTLWTGVASSARTA
jgi:hypothetical protein